MPYKLEEYRELPLLFIYYFYLCIFFKLCRTLEVTMYRGCVSWVLLQTFNLTHTSTLSPEQLRSYKYFFSAGIELATRSATVEHSTTSRRHRL